MCILTSTVQFIMSKRFQNFTRILLTKDERIYGLVRNSLHSNNNISYFIKTIIFDFDSSIDFLQSG